MLATFSQVHNGVIKEMDGLANTMGLVECPICGTSRESHEHALFEGSTF